MKMKHPCAARILSLFLAALLAAGALSGAAAEEFPRLGFTAVSAINREIFSGSFSFSDEWFRSDPGVRNDSLGLASACLSAVAGDGEQAAGLLEELGFSPVRRMRYESGDASDCAYVIGAKEIVRNGEPAVLTAVVFQGMQYGLKGWLQNVTVNTRCESPDQESYAAAARVFFSDLEEMNLSGSPVFWICGMSRGGAVSNLVSAALLEREDAPAVFCYTFESPAVTEKENARGSLYRGIHNYISADDPVPRIPLWGMARYGTDFYYDSLPLAEVKRLVLEKNPAAAGYLEDIREDTFAKDAAAALDWLTGNLQRLIPTREAYAERFSVKLITGETVEFCWQEGLQALCRMVHSDAVTLISNAVQAAGSGSESKSESQPTFNPWDLVADFLEESLVLLKEESSSLPALRMWKRWRQAGNLTKLLRDLLRMDLEPSSVFALSDLFRAVIRPEVILEELGLPTSPPDGTPDDEQAVALVVSLKTGLLFSHMPETIIARMRLLASSPAD